MSRLEGSSGSTDVQIRQFIQLQLEFGYERVGGVRAWAQGNKRLDRLAAQFVEHPDDGRFGDIGVLAEWTYARVDQDVFAAFTGESVESLCRFVEARLGQPEDVVQDF